MAKEINAFSIYIYPVFYLTKLLALALDLLLLVNADLKFQFVNVFILSFILEATSIVIDVSIVELCDSNLSVIVIVFRAYNKSVLLINININKIKFL